MNPSPLLGRSLLDLINIVDNAHEGFERDCAPYYRLYMDPDPRPHGYMLEDTVARMPWPSSFRVSKAHRTVALTAPPLLKTLTQHANEAFQEAVDMAIALDVFPVLHKEHSEYFKVMGAVEPVQIERFASSLFGIACRGAHLTGYVRDEEGLKIWVARRSNNLFTYPGLLDSTVAGGVKASDTPLECIIAESIEEASLPVDWVRTNIVPAGILTSANINVHSGLFHSDVIYTYDLQFPHITSSPLVIPIPNDGEVDGFTLMGAGEVITRMLNGEFKPNVCCVMIDFLVRHGVITEGTRDYERICMRLRRRLPVPIDPISWYV